MHLQPSTYLPFINPSPPYITPFSPNQLLINYPIIQLQLFQLLKKKMAQYGGEQYQKEAGGHNQLHSTTTGHEIGGTGTNIHSTTAGHGIGGPTGGGHGYEEGKHGGGILHRSGSGSSSSSESDGEGGRRKKKGVVKTSETATVGGGGYGHEGLGEEGHEKKGLMEKIKEKLPGGHQ